MNARERFLAVTRFEVPDRIPMPTLFQCFERDTIKRWERDGLPRDIHLAQHFGYDRVELVPVNVGPLPPYEREELEEIEEWRLGLDRDLRKQIGGAIDAVEEEFPIRSRKGWETMKTLLSPESPARYPMFWEDCKRTFEGRDYPLGVSAGSLFGWLREWMGMRALKESLEKEPAFVEEIVDHIADFVTRTLKRAVEEVDVDFAIMREDMSYKVIPLLEDKGFKRILTVGYRRITQFLDEHGVETVLMGCDGRLDGLLSLWVECGINGVYLLEAGAGVDAVALREAYGKELILIGNLDHRAFCRAKRDIADEVRSKVPALMAKGGYIPAPDHPLPSDVPLENYEYYLEVLASIHQS
jgi:uroporphyrinogen-III decarboxylase